MKLLLKLIIIFAPILVFASSEGGHSEGVPKVVLYQFINVSILAFGITYLIKDSVIDFFTGRKTAYLEAAQKSAYAREQAEKELIDIKSRLENLEVNRNESLSKAKDHSEEIKKQILDEAKEVTRRIREEAELTAKLEIQRAQIELRTQLLKDSMETARGILTKDLGNSDEQKLQADFINNVGV